MERKENYKRIQKWMYLGSNRKRYKKKERIVVRRLKFVMEENVKLKENIVDLQDQQLKKINL